MEIQEINNIIKKMRNEVTAIGNRTNQMEERISDIEDQNIETTQKEYDRDFRVKRIERTLQELSTQLEKTT